MFIILPPMSKKAHAWANSIMVAHLQVLVNLRAKISDKQDEMISSFEIAQFNTVSHYT